MGLGPMMYLLVQAVNRMARLGLLALADPVVLLERAQNAASRINGGGV